MYLDHDTQISICRYMLQHFNEKEEPAVTYNKWSYQTGRTVPDHADLKHVLLLISEYKKGSERSARAIAKADGIDLDYVELADFWEGEIPNYSNEEELNVENAHNKSEPKEKN